MKTKLFLITLSLVCFTLSSYSQDNQDPKVLFEKAKYSMESKGDLKEAIELFESLINTYPNEKEYAANSQLMIGMCFEKLGRTEASKAYQLVMDKYPDQGEAVSLARKKLSLLSMTVSEAIPEGLITRRLKEPGSDDVYSISPDGRFVTLIDWSSKSLSLKAKDLQTGDSWPISENGTYQDPWHYPDMSIFSPDGKQVAYIWHAGYDYELRVVNRDGTGLRKLFTRKGDLATVPFDWSRDGKYILAGGKIIDETRPEKFEFLLLRISIIDGSTDTLRYCGDLYGHNACFSPDGKSILFELNQEPGSKNRDIWFRTIDGKQEYKIVEHPANDMWPHWSNDGKFLVFISNRTGSSGIYCQEMYNGHPVGEPLLRKGGLEERFYPWDIINDGSLIYMTMNQQLDVYSVKIDLSAGKLLSAPNKISKRFEGWNWFPSYSPDGKFLAYSSIRGNMTYESPILLVIRNLETGEESDLETDVYASLWPSIGITWTADSRNLVVDGCLSRNIQKDGFFLIDRETGKSELLLGENEVIPERFGSYQQLAPDGVSLYYLSDDKHEFGKTTIVRYNMVSKKKTPVFQPDYMIGNMSLSPDGNNISFLRGIDGRNEIWAIPASGGQAQSIGSLDENISVGMYLWTPDSRSLLVFAAGKCYLSPLDGSQPVEIEFPEGRIKHVKLHPDGKSMAYCLQGIKEPAEIWAIDNLLPKK